MPWQPHGMASIERTPQGFVRLAINNGRRAQEPRRLTHGSLVGLIWVNDAACERTFKIPSTMYVSISRFHFSNRFPGGWFLLSSGWLTESPVPPGIRLSQGPVTVECYTEEFIPFARLVCPVQGLCCHTRTARRKDFRLRHTKGWTAAPASQGLSEQILLLT